MQPPMQPPVTPQPPSISPMEIAAFVIAGLLVIGALLLLYFGTITFAFASSMFILAGGLVGVNIAYKVPSPTQQAQLINTQQNVQQALAQVVAVLPVFASLLHSHGPQPAMPQPMPMAAPQPVAPPQPIILPGVHQPIDNTPPMRDANTGQVWIAPGAPQAQFRSSLPDISMPMNVVLPPGQVPTPQ